MREKNSFFSRHTTVFYHSHFFDSHAYRWSWLRFFFGVLNLKNVLLINLTLIVHRIHRETKLCVQIKISITKTPQKRRKKEIHMVRWWVSRSAVLLGYYLQCMHWKTRTGTKRAGENVCKLADIHIMLKQ